MPTAASGSAAGPAPPPAPPPAETALASEQPAPGATRTAVARGAAWQGVAQWGGKLIGFGVYAAMARILGPRVFGLVAVAWVYVGFTQIFAQQGLGAALIQRLRLEPEHMDTAFWLGMAVACALCGASFAASGWIAALFRTPAAAPLVGWLSLMLPIYVLASVPGALLARQLRFRPVAASTLAATLAGGAVGLAMAWTGFGAWSLVGQGLLGAAVTCGWQAAAAGWRPRLRFSRRHARDLYSVSLGLTGRDVLWFFAGRSDTAFVAYGFGPVALGAYSIARKLTNTLCDGTVGAAQSAALPAISRLQEDLPRFRQAVANFCEWSAFLTLPILAGAGVAAPELVRCIAGPKWMAAVPALRALAAYGCVRVLLGYVYPVLTAAGRMRLYLALEIGLAATTVAACAIALRWNAAGVAWALTVALLAFGTVQTTVICRTILRTPVTAFLRPFIAPVACAALMAAAAAAARAMAAPVLGAWPTLALTALAGAAAYLAAVAAVRRDFLTRFAALARAVVRRQSGEAEAAAAR